MIIFDGPSVIPGQQNRVGQVVILNHPAQLGSVMQFDTPGNWGGFAQFKAIFTNISLREGTNHQLQKTLGNRAYLDVFGDDIGAMQLSGLAFFGNCGAGANQDRIGISHVLEYYHRNKLSRRGNPIRVTIDPNTGYEGYLHTIQAEMFGEQHNANRLYQFSFALAILAPDVA